jgi:AcrR family transcriptional regulator
MARRSDHTREELKELAIRAGQKIIADEGLGKFSARKVAKEIGYTVGTLYNIFESHDDLILYINAATLESLHDFITGRINKEHTGAEAIKELAELYIEFAENNYNRWSALFEFNLPQNTPVPDWYAGKIEALFGVVERPLKQLNNAHRHAKTLWASIHGICQLRLTGKLDVVGAESVRVLTDSMIDHYMQGMK